MTTLEDSKKAAPEGGVGKQLLQRPALRLLQMPSKLLVLGSAKKKDVLGDVPGAGKNG
jgi:hypothetical protein